MKPQNSACWTGVLMQGRRMKAQPPGKLLGPSARYIAGDRPLFPPFCFLILRNVLFPAHPLLWGRFMYVLLEIKSSILR